jgi:hypothetical protein
MSAQNNLGKQFKPSGYDYDGEINGTLCANCHNAFTKKDPDWHKGSEVSPIYKHELKARDPKKQLYIECGECGKTIWGKADLE